MPVVVLLVVVGLLIAAGHVGAIVLFNQLVSQRNRLREAWSGIDVQLKRRHDLVPNLVTCVQGYRDHEKTRPENLRRKPGMRAQSAAGGSQRQRGGK